MILLLSPGLRSWARAFLPVHCRRSGPHDSTLVSLVPVRCVCALGRMLSQTIYCGGSLGTVFPLFSACDRMGADIFPLSPTSASASAPVLSLGR